MSVNIELQETSKRFKATRNDIEFSFTHKFENNTITGSFEKIRIIEDQEAKENIGSGNVGATGLPDLTLRTSSTEGYLDDFKTCIDLIGDAIEHVNNYTNE